MQTGPHWGARDPSHDANLDMHIHLRLDEPSVSSQSALESRLEGRSSAGSGGPGWSCSQRPAGKLWAEKIFPFEVM